MSNVVTLHGNKRWRAVIEYRSDEGLRSLEHYFEEIADLHGIMEHGPDWNCLIRCTVTLNRSDGGDVQKRIEMAAPSERALLTSGKPRLKSS